MVQKSGEVLEGSAFAEKTLAVYRSAGTRKEPKIELKELRLKDGNEALEITNSALPGFALRGDRPGAGGSFELRQLRFLSSHVHGWNEFNLDLLGSASLSSSAESSLLLCIADEVERVQISSGKIRLKSSRLTGTAALTPLRNRRERILALTEWMSQNEQTSQTSLLNRVFSDKEEFEDYWKPLLFPELVSKRKRPAAYSACLAADAPPEWGRADSIKWNRSYTKILFPEELWEFRNSGALLRDWEEALPWIYIEYSWDHIIRTLNETTLQKIK